MPRNNVTSDYRLAIEPVDEYFAPDAYASLKTYFGRVEKGQPEIYDSPFAKGETTDELLEEWGKILVSIKTAWPSLWEFENDLRAKVGPLSVMKPLLGRMSDIKAYYDDILLSSTEISKQAVQRVIREFDAARGLRMRNQLATVLKMKKSTNSGSPYFTKRRNVVVGTVPSSLYWMGNQLNQDLFNGTRNYDACAVLGWRGQEGGPKATDVKQRVIWMFPFAVNIHELQVYQPLIEAFQRFNLVPAWVSMEAVDERITRLFDTKADSDLVVCTDFSRFDQHFNGDLQNAAKDVLKALLSPVGGSSKWLSNIFPIKYELPMAIDYSSCNDRLTDCLKLTRGKHGMASGSGGTNADETLAHRSLQYEAAMNNHSMLNLNSQCLGDDGILSYPGITVKDVVESYSSHGQLMNEDKQYASTQDCTYLRRWHHVNYRRDGICVGVYSTMRALGRMRYQERFYDFGALEDATTVTGPEMVELRYLSILENVKWHPLFEEFVRFCMKKDKYRLGLDLNGFLPNIKYKAEKAIDYMPDFIGYTKTLQSGEVGNPASGIENWAVVRLLKSMS